MRYFSLNILLSIFFLLFSIFVGEKAMDICREQNSLFRGTGIKYNQDASLDPRRKEELESIAFDKLPYGISINPADQSPLVKSLYEYNLLQQWTDYNFRSIDGLMEYLFDQENYAAINSILLHMINNGLVDRSYVCFRTVLCDSNDAISSKVSSQQFLGWLDKAYFVRSERYARQQLSQKSIELWREGFHIASQIDTDWGSGGLNDEILDKAIIVGTFLETNPKPSKSNLAQRILLLSNVAKTLSVYNTDALPFSARSFLSAQEDLKTSCFQKSDIRLMSLISSSNNQAVKDLASFSRVRNRFMYLRDELEDCDGSKDWNTKSQFIDYATEVLDSETMRQGYKTDIIEMLEYIGDYLD